MKSMSRLDLRLLGLCVFVVVLMVPSISAQAANTWMVKDLSLTFGTKALEGKPVSPAIKLLATLGLNKVVFGCKAGVLINAFLEPKGAISEASKNAKVKFSGCTAEINGKVAGECEPVSGTEKGVIETEEGYALLALHEISESEGDDLIAITPKVGNVFALIHVSKFCPVGEELKVLGRLAVVDSAGNAGIEEEKVTHFVEEFAPLTELKVANATLESKATLDGKAELKLAAGELWSGLLEGVNLIPPGGIKLLVTRLGLNKVAFACTAGKLINAKLEPEGAISVASKNARVKFSGCTTEINGKVAVKCEPFDGTEKGVIETEEGYASLASHELSETEKDGVIVITPTTGNVFAAIHMPPPCAISEEVKVFGSLAVKDSEGNSDLEKETAVHTFEEFAPLTELTVTNEEAESKATLDGKARVELISGEAWNGLTAEDTWMVKGKNLSSGTEDKEL